MTAARIRFATDILRRLGEELNPSADQSIVELVKNSYDADAIRCRVKLAGTEQAGGTIQVVDDGDGMTASEVETGWLVLGRTEKNQRKVTKLGRVPAGSKGLGRLAALRMGSRARLSTRPREEPANEYTLEIDWNKFDKAQLVEDVPLSIEKHARPPDKSSGTEVVVSNLHGRVGRAEVKRLARSLILLADPFVDNPIGFRPSLEASEFLDLERLVQNRYFSDADYHLIAEVDASGRSRASVVDFRDRVLFSAEHHEIARDRDGEEYRCPPARLELWVFLLTSEKFTPRVASLDAIREWLQEFGGVHVYYNGLRVAPYGGPGNDWLEMNLRRAQSPEERPSTNTSIGRLNLADDHGILTQKTDRSGFIETEPFIELRTFAQDALEWMARSRMRVAELRRSRQKTAVTQRRRKSRIKLEAEIRKTPKASQQKLKQALGNYDRSRDREVGQLRKEVQLYRTLGTAGITAATFAHESAINPIKVVSQSINAIERRARPLLGTRYESSIAPPVESVKTAVASLAVLGNVTLSLVDHEKRRSQKGRRAHCNRFTAGDFQTVPRRIGREGENGLRFGLTLPDRDHRRARVNLDESSRQQRGRLPEIETTRTVDCAEDPGRREEAHVDLHGQWPWDLGPHSR